MRAGGLTRFLAAWGALSAISGGQVAVSVKPIAGIAVKRVFGRRQDVTFATVALCNDYPANVTVPRERIMMGAPQVSDLPGHLAEDVVFRGVDADARSVIGANGDSLLGFAATGLSIGGWAAGSRGAGYAGLGITAIQLILQLVRKSAPNARPYASDLLPAAVPLGAGACSTYGLVAAGTVNPTAFSISLPQRP